MELTDRQLQILKAIIQEYTESAEAVGSQTLAEKYDLHVSPATLRNEMSDLVAMGYLEKEHVSAGRIPSSMAYRIYITQLMDEQEIPVVSEVTIKQRVWEQRHDVDRMIRQMVATLADEAQNLAVAVTPDGRVYHSGSVHVLRHPEFYNIDLTRSVLHMLDRAEVMMSVFDSAVPEQDIGVLLADEIGITGLSQCGLIYARFSLPNGQQAQFGVLGPMRLNYARIMPLVRYFKQILDQMTRSW